MIYYIFTAAIIILDQMLKFEITQRLALGETLPFIPHLIELTRVHNTGAAWGSFSGQKLILLVLPVLLIGGVLFLLRHFRVRHWTGRCAVALIIAGGIGNLIDRIRLGYVVDMFHFLFWKSYPVFNIADIAVVCGAVLGVVYYLFLYEKYDAEGTD